MSGYRMRRGSSTAWTAANPVLGQGEPGLDLNNSLFKIGNGVSSWTQLPYYTGGGLGTVSAGTTNATGPGISFANSNGVTFGINGNTITASAAGGGGGGGAALSAGTQSGNTGTIVFANSNGLTFGMSGSNQITGSHNGLTSQSNQALSGSNGSFTFQTATFGNLNGLSFYTSNGSLVGSHNGIQQIAFNANVVSGTRVTLYGAAPLTFSPIDGDEVELIHNGESYYAVGNTTQSSSGTFSPAVHTVRGAGELSVGVSNGSLVLSSPAQTIQTQNLVSVQGSTGNISFSNSNGITFGFNASTITASHNGLTSQSNQALSAGNGSFAFQTASFVNSNGISFSTTAGSGIVASHNGLTTARASNDGVGLNTALTAGPLAWTVNSNGISLNAGSAAGTTSGFAGNLISGSMTHNTAGLNLSLNHPAWLTTAAQSNHSHGNPTLALTNLSGTTASNSNGLTLSLSAAAGGGGGADGYNILAAGSQTANTATTVVFVDSNGILFGMSGNSRITASHDGITGIYLPSDGVTVTQNVNLLTFTNLGNRVSARSDGADGIGFEGFAPWVGISTQGNTSGTTGILSNGNLVLVGGNNITLSQATGGGGNTITISGAAGGGGNTENHKAAVPIAMINTQTFNANGSTRIVWPSDFQNAETVGFLRMPQTVSITSNASIATSINTSFSYGSSASFYLVAYTRGTGANSQSLQSIASTSWSTLGSASLTANTTGSQYTIGYGYVFPVSNTAASTFSSSYVTSVTNFAGSTTGLTALSGAKIMGVPWATSFPAERIWFAFNVVTASASNGPAAWTNAGRALTSGYGLSQVNLTWAEFGAANNASIQAVSGVGSFTTNNTQTTASFGFSNISSSGSHVIPYLSFAQII